MNKMTRVKYSLESSEYLKVIPPFFTRILIYVIFLLLAVAILYLYFGRINNIVTTQFILMPKGGVKKIQGKRSGSIVKILCKVNDHVRPGDILFNVKSQEVISEYSEIEKAKLKVKNLEDEISQNDLIEIQSLRELDSKLSSLIGQLKVKQNEIKNIDDELKLKQKYYEGEKEIKNMMIGQYGHENEITQKNYKNEIARLKNQIIDLQVDLDSLKKELELRKKEFDNNQLLFKTKEILEREYNNSKILYDKIKTDIKKITNNIKLLEKETASKEEEVKRKNDLFKKKIALVNKELQLAKIQQKETEIIIKRKKTDLQLAIENLKYEIESTKASIKEKKARSKADKIQIKGNIKSLQIDFDKLMSTVEDSSEENIYQIKSPYIGTITQLNINTLGTVISPGEVLLHIAPENEPIVAETYIPNVAIGMVQLNQRVLMKYDAYTYQKFGIQNGKVLSISPDAVFLAENTDPVYRAVVELETQFLDTYQGIKPLRYGMKGIAEIITSRDRIIARFIKGFSDIEEIGK